MEYPSTIDMLADINEFVCEARPITAKFIFWSMRTPFNLVLMAMLPVPPLFGEFLIFCTYIVRGTADGHSPTLTYKVLSFTEDETALG